MSPRRRLPNRRPSTTFTFQCGPHKYIATASYFQNGALAEIFLSNGRAGSDIDAAAKDSAVLASIGLQYGIPLDVLRKALLRDAHGKASSPFRNGTRHHRRAGGDAMSEPQPRQRRRPVYLLRLQCLRGDDIRRLRWLLKALLRRHQLRCVSIEVERGQR